MKFSLYGLFVGIAVAIGWYVTEIVYEKRGGHKQDINRAVWPLLICGLVGARLYHVIDYWDVYRENVVSVILIWEGGLGIWGAIAGGLVGLLRVREYRADIAASVATILPLSQAIGRVANGINGEFGENIWLLPWWAMEALGNLFLFAILWHGSTVLKLSSNRIVALYLIGYGLIRLVLEWERENVWTVGSIPTAVIVSLLSLVLGLVVWQRNVRG